MYHRRGLVRTSRQVGLLLVVVVMAFAVGVSPVVATPGSSETILLKRDSNRNEIGWSASGAFADAGSWTSDFAAFGGGPSGVFAGTIKTTETGASGSFKIQFQVHGDGGKDFKGTWVISSGSGVYAHLKGEGTWTHADLANGDGLFTCVGQVHFDG